MGSLLSDVLDWLLPDCCAICGGAQAGPICAPCARALIPNPFPCPRCGLPATHHGVCQPLPFVDRVFAPFLYRPPLRNQILAFKFASQRSVGRALSCALIEAIGPILPEISGIVPVPLHRARLRQRTFNQAEDMARTIARAIKRPLFAGNLRRTVATAAQSALPAASRRTNVHGAFTVSGVLPAGRLALIDDVITTGATVSACSAALRAHGAEAVVSIAIARVLPSEDDAVPSAP